MKNLKIASFVSVALYFVLDFVYEWERTMLGSFYDFATISDLRPHHLHIINKLHVIEQYQVLCLYIAVPLVLIYLFKRLK
jgi:hypothetical protein